MKYYNSRGEIEKIDVGVPKIKATNSNIYELENGIYFKEYLSKTKLELRMTYEIFEILKKLNSSFTNKILEPYYSIIFDSNIIKENPSSYCLSAYKYKYLEEEPRDMLRESTEYFLYNVGELERLLLEIFVDYNIMAHDLKRENSVFYDGRIVLIDLDCCRVENNKKREEILKHNIHRFNYLLHELLTNCKSFQVKYLGGIDNLLWMEDDDKSLYDILARRLAKYKKPIDYVRRRLY